MMKKNYSIKIWAIIFWLCLWQVGSLIIGKEILIISPLKVIERLRQLVIEAEFWKSIGFSFFRISLGFLSASITGIVLAALSAHIFIIRELIYPMIFAIKSIPVASFIILALVWFSSRNLSICISFLIVLPVIYINVLKGIQETDKQLIEMIKVFQIPKKFTIKYLYIFQIMPFFQSGCEVALGLCWKSGIAAEVIGMPEGSIGEKLQQAKIYLDTKDLFAWTLVIVIISVFFEKFFLILLKRIYIFFERM